MLEGSNVNPIESMVGMIQTARQFEAQMRLDADRRIQRPLSRATAHPARLNRKDTTMINSLWISKTGMEAQQMQLDVISNNLANVSTNGFKKSHAVFEDLMYQNLRQVGSATPQTNRRYPPACNWAWACAP